MKKIVNYGAIILATICLCISYLAAGFAVCACVPQVTTGLSGATCTYEISPFNKDELTQMALAGRNYTFWDNDKEALYDAIWEINESAAADGRAGNGSVDTSTNATVQAREKFILNADEQYTLDAEAISHLDDVYKVVKAVRIPLVIIAVLAVAAAAHVLIRINKRAFGCVLATSGAIVLAAFLILGAFAVINFNSFFDAFHSLFFAQGTWYFSYDSLLICMYPTAFWIGMAIIWFATSVILSILSIWLGKRAKK